MRECFGTAKGREADSTRASETVRASFRVAFRTEGAEAWPAYVKLLFWTDAAPILGLLPPGAPGAQRDKSDSLRLVFAPTDDYPNGWAESVDIRDGDWQDVRIDVAETAEQTGAVVTVRVAGQTWTRQMPIDVGSNSLGPQLGVYSFDYPQEAAAAGEPGFPAERAGGLASSPPSAAEARGAGALTLTIGAVDLESDAPKHACVLDCLETCDAESKPAAIAEPRPVPSVEAETGGAEPRA
jgi:hypothetical protein